MRGARCWKETVQQLRDKRPPSKNRTASGTDRDAYYHRYFPGVPRRVVDETWDSLVAAARQGRRSPASATTTFRPCRAPAMCWPRSRLAACGWRWSATSRNSNCSWRWSGPACAATSIASGPHRPAPDQAFAAAGHRGSGAMGPSGQRVVRGRRAADMLASDQAGIRRCSSAAQPLKVQAIEAAQTGGADSLRDGQGAVGARARAASAPTGSPVLMAPPERRADSNNDTGRVARRPLCDQPLWSEEGG